MADDYILKVEDLWAGYEEDIAVVKKITMVLQKGLLTAVVGANGAGKSTLLKTIYGFLKPFSGKILYNGAEVTGWSSHEAKKAGVAYIPQDLSHFPDMTVEENLRLGWWIWRGKRGLSEQLEWVYELFPNLLKKRNMKASFLSGGEVKMLDIARGILVKPQLLLVDEPSVGLSPKLAEEVYRVLQRLRGEGITVLLVDQNVKRAIEICDYAYVMDTGEIISHGSSDVIRHQIEQIIEASLMGDLIKF
ncbi:MAG: ABC transporter ATP-binding protein [Candidatus Caldarchaeum sp.]